MKWSRLVLTIVAVLGFAAVASAESAWVLWSQHVALHAKPRVQAADFGVGAWAVQNAYEKRQECIAELEKYISMLEALYKGTKTAEVKRDEYAGRHKIYVWRTDKDYEIFSAACLPETVDPRPRK